MFNLEFQEELFAIFDNLTEEKSTVNLQKMALFDFLRDLGYVPANNIKDYSRGAVQIKNNWMPKEISLQNAVALYNGSLTLDWSASDPLQLVLSHWGMRATSISEVYVTATDGEVNKIGDIFANKLFLFNSLQYSKKSGYTASNNWVVFGIEEE